MIERFIITVIGAFVGIVVLYAFLAPLQGMIALTNDYLVNNATAMSNTSTIATILSLTGLLLGVMFLLMIVKSMTTPPNYGQGGF